MYLGRGMWKKKRTRYEKWEIVKNTAKVFAIAQMVVCITFGILKANKMDNLKSKMNELANENGYNETVSMDEFMESSENVSKEEYHEYKTLKEEIKHSKTQGIVGVSTMGALAIGGVILSAIAEDKENDFFPIY